VTEYEPDGDLRNIPLQDVKVGAANGRAVHADNRIRVVLDCRFGHFFPGLLSRSVVDERFHDVLGFF
jgi:hypothetical protein